MFAAGQTLAGRYHLTRVVHEDALRTVFQATLADERHSRLAVTVFRAEPLSNPAIAERFHARIEAWRGLRHPHIVHVVDQGTTPGDELEYYVTEWVSSFTLRNMIDREGALPEAFVDAVARQVLEALSSAHRAGVLHCDLRPQNILLTRTSAGELRVKITGFELVRTFWPEFPHGSHGLSAIARVGSPDYMAYEQVLNLPEIDGRVDLYALGLIMHEILTGTRLFVEDVPESIVSKQKSPHPLPLNRGLLHQCTVGHIIEKATQKDRNHRYGTAKEMLSAIWDANVEPTVPLHQGQPVGIHAAETRPLSELITKLIPEGGGGTDAPGSSSPTRRQVVRARNNGNGAEQTPSKSVVIAVVVFFLLAAAFLVFAVVAR